MNSAVLDAGCKKNHPVEIHVPLTDADSLALGRAHRAGSPLVPLLSNGNSGVAPVHYLTQAS